MPGTEFGNARVLSLESRRSREMAQLIANYGGQPTVAPSTREVPSGPNPQESSFAEALRGGQFDMVIFMTGVGTRALAQAIEPICPRDKLVESLSRTIVVARGPKPVTVLREFGVPITLTVPEPHTWREILQTLDQSADKAKLTGARVAVQEHGAPSPDLYSGLAQRGAQVFPVPVYKWEPPEDTGPLRDAVARLGRKEFEVVLFTSSVQIHHLFRFAEEMKQRDAMAEGLHRAVVASIGPVTSETLREYGIAVDVEPSHPKMGFLVKETAEQSAQLLAKKRSD